MKTNMEDSGSAPDATAARLEARPGRRVCSEHGPCDKFPDCQCPYGSDYEARDARAYAIEHAGYLATAAEAFMASANELTLAFESEDGAGAAMETYSDHAKGLRECIYEFRKRADRAATRQQSTDGGVESRHADEARGAHAHALADDLDSPAGVAPGPSTPPAAASNLAALPDEALPV